MKILILGGTRFLGRHLVDAALHRGHQVSLFNRGETNPELFPEVERLRGNRDGQLSALKGREWDAVIDTCGYVSVQVRASAALLAESVARYVFISSISVYRDFSKPGMEESARVAELPEGAMEDAKEAGTYGARKALCEQVVESELPGRALVIRPGIIIGPYDNTGRFTYWVRRIGRGGEVLAPGHEDMRMQLIDARDLALWIVQIVEQRRAGTYNATGPASPLTFRGMLEACRRAVGSNAQFTWGAEQFLLDQGVAPFVDLPLWIPERETEYAGHFSVDCRRAFSSGLTCRPLEETARDTQDWDRQELSVSNAGLSAERESELLAAWKHVGVRTQTSTT